MDLSLRQFVKGPWWQVRCCRYPVSKLNQAISANKELRIYAWAGYITDEM